MSDLFASDVIKGQQYKLMKLDPLKAGRLAAKVIQNLAGAVSDVETIRSLIDAFAQRGTDQAEEAQEQVDGVKEKLQALMETPQLISALAGGIGKINVDQLYDIAVECVKGNLFADRKLHDDQAFNHWFADHPDHLLLVLAWAIRVNCQGFFGLGGKA